MEKVIQNVRLNVPECCVAYLYDAVIRSNPRVSTPGTDEEVKQRADSGDSFSGHYINI